MPNAPECPERALIWPKSDTSKPPKDVQVEPDRGRVPDAIWDSSTRQWWVAGPDLDPKLRRPWSHRLFYAYADNLVAAGRTEEAVQWFLHAAEADEEGETDAAERAGELTG